MIKRLLIVWASLLTLACETSGQSQTVDIPSHDGFVLKGSLWSQDNPAPGILLLHQCDGDRSMYQELGNRLYAAGFHVLAFDFRGLGESTGKGFDLKRAGGRENWDRALAKFPADVEAAYRFLRGTADVQAGRTGVLGASCGGGQLITLARAHPDVAALAFLSARLSTEQISELSALRDKPVLFIAAEGDRRAADAARKGVSLSQSEVSRQILYSGKDHGFPLFRKDPKLVETIVTWFRERLAD